MDVYISYKNVDIEIMKLSARYMMAAFVIPIGCVFLRKLCVQPAWCKDKRRCCRCFVLSIIAPTTRILSGVLYEESGSPPLPYHAQDPA